MISYSVETKMIEGINGVPNWLLPHNLESLKFGTCHKTLM